jgi:predicted metal-binding protein
MTTTITVCETCKCAGWDVEKNSQTDGAALADLIEGAAISASGVVVRRHSCLMGCDFACNIAIQSPDKLNYVLGNFEPTDTDAQGIVDYATQHANSETGQVPYREWPQAIKGHFRARLPLLPTET